MGTKLEELRNGCFAAAMDDEPMFVLLARDPRAADLADRWADDREADISLGKKPASDMSKVREARQCAANMRAWRETNDGAWRKGLFARQEQLAGQVKAGVDKELPQPSCTCGEQKDPCPVHE
jgi:hypothetical protein